MIRDISEKVSNFSDPYERKQIILNFFYEADKGPSYLLNMYQFPVFYIKNDVHDEFVDEGMLSGYKYIALIQY